MPKMKTRRAVAKRIRVTAKGKVKIKKANLRHILTKKKQDNKRNQVIVQQSGEHVFLDASFGR